MTDLLAGFGAPNVNDVKTIKAWSFSGLRIFEACPERARRKYIDREPEAPRDANNPAERGIRIHANAEQYITGEAPELIPELTKHYKAELNRLRERYDEQPEHFAIEQDWGFDADWQPTGFFDENVWCRMKLDVLEFPEDSPETAVIIDWKSGKKFGNEMKYNQQGQLYAIGTFVKYPEIQALKAQFLFTDTGEKMNCIYARDKLPPIITNFTKRGLAMTSAVHFPAKANKMNCRYCPYSMNNGGTDTCPYGVEV